MNVLSTMEVVNTTATTLKGLTTAHATMSIAGSLHGMVKPAQVQEVAILINKQIQVH